jgi:phosphoribosylanthranilate isomerase
VTALIKICGLRDRDMVNKAVAAGADAIGFVFADSVRRVTVREAMTAASEIPQRVLRVAVMMHPSKEEWTAVASEFQPDVLQTDIADFEYLDVPPNIVRWPVIREDNTDAQTFPDTFVYEGAKSGQGQTVDWQRAAGIAARGNMILAGGLSVDNVATAIATVSPYGVDVSSAVESAPGQKDPHKIKSFINAAKNRTKDIEQ